MSRPSIVDLTSSSPPGGNSSSPSNWLAWEDPGRQLHDSSQNPPDTKRRRLNNSNSNNNPPPSSHHLSGSSSFFAARPPFPQSNSFPRPTLILDDIEAVDLTGDANDARILKTIAKQQQDVILAQQKEMVDSERSRSTLLAYKCPVCMDTPVDATATLCGHLFCHKCIIDTLRFCEERRALEGHSNKTPRGNCPVCRKPLSRVDTPGTRRNLVPLQIKLMTKKKDA